MEQGYTHSEQNVKEIIIEYGVYQSKFLTHLLIKIYHPRTMHLKKVLSANDFRVQTDNFSLGSSTSPSACQHSKFIILH